MGCTITVGEVLVELARSRGILGHLRRELRHARAESADRRDKANDLHAQIARLRSSLEAARRDAEVYARHHMDNERQAYREQLGARFQAAAAVVVQKAIDGLANARAGGIEEAAMECYRRAARARDEWENSTGLAREEAGARADALWSAEQAIRVLRDRPYAPIDDEAKKP
jgi:hypothetical protein